jgi:hypothetical protein
MMNANSSADLIIDGGTLPAQCIVSPNIMQATGLSNLGVAGSLAMNRLLTPFSGTNQTLTAVIMLAGIIVGTPTGAANYTTDSAVNIVAAVPACYVGLTFPMEIRNTSGAANTITVLAGMGVTLAGTMTIAQNAFRQFNAHIANCGTPAVTLYGTASGAF